MLSIGWILKRSEIAIDAKSNRIKLTNSQLGIEVLLLGLIIFIIYLYLSLFSFDPGDPGWSQAAMDDIVRNWGGMLGAYFADILLQIFGVVAYLIPLALLILCTQLVHYFYFNYGNPINYFMVSLRLIGLLSFLFSLAGFFALNVADWPQYQSGGILGLLIASEIYPLFNQIGSSLLFLSLWLVSITLLTGYSWLFFAERFGAFVVLVTWPFLNIVSLCLNWRKAKYQTEEQLVFTKVDITTQSSSLLSRLITSLCHGFVKYFWENDKRKATIDLQKGLCSDETGKEEYKFFVEKAEDDSEFIKQGEPPQSQLNETTEDRYYQSSLSKNDIFLAKKEGNLEINRDYYSPIKDKLTEKETDKQQDISVSVASIDGSLPTPASIVETIEKQILNDEERVQQKQYEEVAANRNSALSLSKINQQNIRKSVIHPFLFRHTAPVSDPKTPMPCYDLLNKIPVQRAEIDVKELESMARRIEKSLTDFRVKARVVDYRPGPVVTLFEIELAPGVKASRISTLDRDLARSLSMPSVRVVEVIPGKPYVGLELPNKHRETVYFREVIDTPEFRDATSPLTIVLGKDIGGIPIVADIIKTPHLLVAGTTGSGKSVGVNAMILSILYKSTPDDVRFIMIDPKMLELSIYEGIPHLLTDVVTDMKDAANALNWCINEMERRYRLMSVVGVRNLAGYNEKIKLAQEMGEPIPDPLWKANENKGFEMPNLEKLPYIVVIVDEFADLIMAVGKKVEELIARLAQKARASGIHLVLATQRPSVDVITGLIKANIPTRIGFTVSSKIDSRTILDQSGAESLLGMGDMLYLAPNSSVPIRVHGAFVLDNEVHAVVQDWKARGTPKYVENITTSVDNDGFDSFDEDLDPLFDQVVAFVVEKKRASISGVQRQFRIGYNRAARIVEQMEMQGIVSPPSHNGNREVIASSANHDF